MGEAIVDNGHLWRPAQEVASAALVFSHEEQTIYRGRDLNFCINLKIKLKQY